MSISIIKLFSFSLVKNRKVVICDIIREIGRDRDNFIYDNNHRYFFDYVRFSSLELISHEISERNTQGCVAELGVFDGYFAQYINVSFPTRKLYLFDTFDGFDQRDIDIELKNSYSIPQNYDLTINGIDLVINKMKYPDNCIIRKGYFPETVKDLEEKFVFVNIDVDLFEPVFQGLNYFYPRLQKGGYIFVHDYNNCLWKGVKDAVKKFSEEFNIPYFPLSDRYGSVAFIK
jgi:O-methyltransferase